MQRRLFHSVVTAAALAGVALDGPSAWAVVRSCSAGPCAIDQRCECKAPDTTHRGFYVSAGLQRTLSPSDIFLSVGTPAVDSRRRLVGLNVVAFQADGLRALGCSVFSNGPGTVTVSLLGINSATCDTAATLTVAAAIDET